MMRFSEACVHVTKHTHKEKIHIDLMKYSI